MPIDNFIKAFCKKEDSSTRIMRRSVNPLFNYDQVTKE